jgi:hypothetical protein
MDSSLQKDDLKKFCSSFRASRKRGSPENNLQDLMEKSQEVFVVIPTDTIFLEFFRDAGENPIIVSEKSHEP